MSVYTRTGRHTGISLPWPVVLLLSPFLIMAGLVYVLVLLGVLATRLLSAVVALIVLAIQRRRRRM